MSQTVKQTKIISWIPVVIWMVLIFYLSHQPASGSNELSSGVMNVFLKTMTSIIPNDINLGIFHHLIRKSAHFFAYFILGFLIFHALKNHLDTQWKRATIAFGMSVLYAASDEFHQLFIPGRSGQIGDVFIDSAGSVTGIAVYIVLGIVSQRLCRS